MDEARFRFRRASASCARNLIILFSCTFPFETNAPFISVRVYSGVLASVAAHNMAFFHPSLTLRILIDDAQTIPTSVPQELLTLVLHLSSRVCRDMISATASQSCSPLPGPTQAVAQASKCVLSPIDVELNTHASLQGRSENLHSFGMLWSKRYHRAHRAEHYWRAGRACAARHIHRAASAPIAKFCDHDKKH